MSGIEDSNTKRSGQMPSASRVPQGAAAQQAGRTQQNARAGAPQPSAARKSAAAHPHASQQAHHAAAQRRAAHPGSTQQHPTMRSASRQAAGAGATGRVSSAAPHRVSAQPAGQQRPHAAAHPGQGHRSAAYGQAGGTSHARTAPTGTRVASPRPAASARYVRHDRRSGQRLPLIAAAVAIVVIAGIALGACYQFMWRSVDITVNGQTYSQQINSGIQQLLEDNDYFGAKAGALLSVSGNVIDEAGGDRCSVTANGEQVAASDIANLTATDGLELSVTDGADTTEPYTEQEVSMAPGIQTDGTGAIQFVSQWGRAGKKKVWVGDQSGETVDKEVIEEPTDMVVSALNPKPKDGNKYMALTFDDGPSSYTGRILDILKQYGVKATFFNLGGNVNSTSKTVVDNGNEMASHTNQHMNLPKCDRDTLRSEITTAFDAIEQASGVRPQMIRAPYGAFTSTEWARSGDLISCNVLWNIDTLDWERPGAEAIKNTVLSNAYNGAIALMHDGGGNREQDIEALPGIIEGLQADGYQLVTVSELMELDGRFPQEVIDGTVSMPEDAVLPEM